jgi:ATP-binding protein involved in chromosome partitioning
MSYFICPHCGERTDIFAHGGARQEAERLQVPFLGEVPLDIQIRLTSDAGTPIVAAEPDSAHTQVYRAIATKVWEGVRQERAEGGRLPPEIVME